MPDAFANALLREPLVAVFGQLDPSAEGVERPNLRAIGCAARVMKAEDDGEGGNVTLLLHGQSRVQRHAFTRRVPYLEGTVTHLTDRRGDGEEARALASTLGAVAKKVIQLIPEIPRGAPSMIDSIRSPASLADLVASNLDAPAESAALLEELDVPERLCALLLVLCRQLESVEMRARIEPWVQAQLTVALDGTPEDDLRRLALGLRRRFVESELGIASGRPGRPGEGPYRANAARAAAATAYRIDLVTAGADVGGHRWRSWLQAPALARVERFRARIEEQLVSIRTGIREEILYEQLEAIAAELGER